MDQLVHPTLLLSIAFRLWQIYLPKIVRQCGQLSSSPSVSAVYLWWAMMIGWVIWVMKVNQNVKKVPLSHQKMKNSFLYYIQLLMIDQVIQATKINWNAKKTPKSSKNEMLGFGLHSTSDDQPSDLSDEHWPKQKKGPLTLWKIKCSFLDYVQFLMIGWAIWVMNIDQNAKKGRKAPDVIEN